MVPVSSLCLTSCVAFLFFSRFRERVGIRVVKALKRQDDGVTHAAIDMLCALMQVFH